MTGRDQHIAALFREHADALYRAAIRMLGDPGEAEDAVQDAFVKLRRSKNRLDDLDSPKAWLFTVLRNVCVDRQRGAARRSMLASDRFDADAGELGGSGWSSRTPESEVLTSETLSHVSKAMEALPPIDAETLTLVVVEGLSYREVADITGVPVGTVRSRLNRARRTLRDALPGALAEGPDAAGAHPVENVIPLRRVP